MPEVALNLPFDSGEIKDIACAEFRKRLDQLGPLQGAKEYAKFDLSFNVAITLRRVGETTLPKETLAWGSVVKETAVPDGATVTSESAQVLDSKFTSGDPNTERQARGMPLTVESTDGKGGKTRRRVKIENPPPKAKKPAEAA